MITAEDKLKIVNEKIQNYEYTINQMSRYIDLINSGMQDPDMDIDECEEIIADLSQKVEILNIEKQTLTNLL